MILPNRRQRVPSAAPTFRLATAGFFATAIAFGPARMGFGLFVPAFREDFALSTTEVGVIASGGFLAFLLALPLATFLCARWGERLPVVIGALLAACGFALVVHAEGAIGLASGISLAGMSAGLCWTPFNDAAERVVPPHAHAGALSAVSTGTTVGVTLAAVLALGVTFGALDWRTVWLAFAFGALWSAFLALIGVPGGRANATASTGPLPKLVRRETMPLFVITFIYGATNAIYLSFAADRVVLAGGLPGLPERAASAVIFLGYGLFGALGLATGRIESRLGLSPLIAAIFTAFAMSLALIAGLPASWPGVVASAGLHGAAVMTFSAVVSFWSLRLFPRRSSLGFTAALVATASGSVLGPLLAGPLLEAVGATAAFLLLAAPSLAVAIAFTTKGQRA